MKIDKETTKIIANSVVDMGMIKKVEFVEVSSTLLIYLDDAFNTVLSVESATPLSFDVIFDTTETKKVRKSVFEA